MDPKESAQTQIEHLVASFKTKIDSGKVDEYNEQQVKQYFIRPLFQALGWDFDNDEEVVPEDKVSKGWVDYAFKIKDVTKFYVEAKRPGADLEKVTFARQAIEYAWHKGITWAILTNFKEFRIYNAEILKENPLFCEVLQPRTKWKEYATTGFDKLWYFSKESIQKGELDTLAESMGVKTRRVPIGDQLLKDLIEWREMLSKDITKNNQDRDLSSEDLDECVQRILDRFIFIKKCEDLGLEDKGLWEKVQNYRFDNCKKRLVEYIRDLFTEFDRKYDSELFSPALADQVLIDGPVLEKIIRGFYRRKDSTQYDFAFIDADILGNAYEQYLGHILKKTEKRAKLESKTAHRKEQGIYYTPTYIVDYIVKNTVGELLKNKKVDPKKIKILDPACGSGSFLIKAHDYLLKESKGKRDRLDVLRENIFGVDLDSKAVEIARLNLLLKSAVKREKLPTLAENIKCGNSLIDDPCVAKYKAFKWNEKFKGIMNRGGFDVVIGNPPYVRPHKISAIDKKFFWRKLKTFRAKSDLYSCFMEKSIGLLKEGGLFSFIVPHTWTSLESFYEIRRYILDTCKVVKLVQLPKKVFQTATVETTIFLLKKEKNESERNSNSISVESLDEIGNVKFVKKFKQSQIKDNHLCNFELYSEEAGKDILKKIEKNGIRLGDFIDFFYGLKTGEDSKFIFDSPKNSECKKLLRSKDIDRYSKNFNGEYVWYVPDLMTKNKKTARPGSKERFESEKIIVARMGKRVVATHDDEKYYIKDGMLLLAKSDLTNLRWLTGSLNSKVINYYYKNYFVTIDVLKNALLELPIAYADESDIIKISKKVEKLEDLNKQLYKIRGKKTRQSSDIEEKIDAINTEIDELVYKLYGITEKEKKIIEESLG